MSQVAKNRRQGITIANESALSADASRLVAGRRRGPPSSPPAFARYGPGYARWANGEMPLSHIPDYDTIMTSWGGGPALGANSSVRQGLVYMSQVSQKLGAGSYHYGVPLEQARTNGWVLLDTLGNECLNAAYGYPICDPDLPGYQQAWCDNVYAKLIEWGVDGVFIDDVLWYWVSLTGTNPTLWPVKYTSQQQWQNAVVEWCTFVHSFMQARGKYMVINAGAWYSGSNDDPGNNDYDHWTELVAHADGLMSEHWVTHPNWPNGYKGFWDSWARLAELADSNGKAFFTTDYGPVGDPTNPTPGEYALRSILVCTDNGTIFWGAGGLSTFDRTLHWRALYDQCLALGSPTGAKFSVGNERRRQYQNGLVWVNISNFTSGII